MSVDEQRHRRSAVASSRRGPVAAAVAAAAAVCAGLLATTGGGRASAAVIPPQPHRDMAAAAATVPIGPFTLDISNREAVRQFFNLVHEASNNVAAGWTGSIAGCNAGSVSPGFLAATLSRINYFRTMAGEPDVTFNGTDAGTSSDPNNAEAQAAALMESANNFINHTPPQTGTACWTQQAFDGSSHSNLFAGLTGPPAIDGFMNDSGSVTAANALGHRRNMLNPSISVMGSGSVTPPPGNSTTEAQLVLTTPLAQRPAVRSGFVAWPPAGFVPYQAVFSHWSFALPNADFSTATVSMQHNGAALQAQVQCVDPNVSNDVNCGQFGEPAISWVPNNSVDPWSKPLADDPYTVTVGHVLVNGTPQTFTYTVTVIDPATSDTAHTATVPSGPTSPPVNTNSTYSETTVPDATGYQWRTTTLTPGDVVDGAEAGPGNWTASVSPAGNNTISTVEHATGTSSFRLDAFGGTAQPDPQTLTFNQTLLANATSSLSFDTLYWSMLNEAAQVDVSVDGGATWTAVFRETPLSSEQDTAFTHRTVSLGQFAGRQMQLRFSLNFTGGSWMVGCCGEPLGWYVDNVTLSGVQDAATPVLGAVGANTFSFNPAQVSPFAVDVRPQFTNGSFGSSFGAWSPALSVTSVGGTTGLVSLTSSANPAGPSQQITWTATVAPTDGGGTLSFTLNGNPMGGCQSLPLSGQHQATCQASFDTSFPISVVATYSGDGSFSGASSPVLTQTINAPVFDTGSLTASSGQVNGGQPVTFTATITPAGAPITDGGGTISFTNNGTVMPGCAAVPLTAASQATCTYTSAGPEFHSPIDASYSGDAGFAPVTNMAGGTVTLNVEALTAVSAVQSSANPSSIGQVISYTVTVTPLPAAQNGTVQFTDNGSSIPGCGLLQPDHNTGAVTCTMPSPYSSGSPHAIQTFYTKSNLVGQFAPSASAVLSQVVGTLTATTTSLSASVNPATTGQQVTYTVTVSPTDNGGSVTFTDFNEPAAVGCLSAIPLNNVGQATCVVTFADTAPHSIVAVFSGDASFAVSSSASVNQTVHLATPAAPGNAAAFGVGTGAAQVAFQAPAATVRVHSSSVLSAVTGYNVYQGTSPGQESNTPVNPSRILATASGFTVTRLTNGRHYYFVVRAQNAGGLGAKSVETSAVPASAPGPPRSLIAHAAKESAVLSWLAPSTTGGTRITGYNVFLGTAAGGESAKPANPAPLAASARGYTVNGLVDGTTYFFTVKASSSRAASPTSNETSARPATVPGAPFGVATSPANASVVLTWFPSDTTGGAPLSGFNVYKGTASGHEATTPVNSAPLPATATTYSASGLTNGIKYYFTLKAINAVGLSTASGESSTTPIGAGTTPSAPLNLAATRGAATVGLSWAAPSSTGGAPISGYNVYQGTLSGFEGSTPVNPSPLAATARSYTATSLTNGVTYVFFVRAINGAGAGTRSKEVSATPEAAATVAAAPRTPAASSPASGQVALTWSTPSWNGGSAITGYNVYVGTAPGGESSTPRNASPLPGTATSYTVTGLTRGTPYLLVVKAINAVGLSAASAEVSATA